MTGNGSKEIVVNFFCNPPFVGEMGRDKRRTVNRKTYESGLLESKIARSIFWTVHFWVIENFKSGSICEKKLFIKLSLWKKKEKKGLWIRIRKFYIDSWNENDLSDNLPLACAYPFIVNQTKMCYICFKIAVTFPDMGLQRTHYLFRW